MMFEGPVQRLIDELGRLPGIGNKSAQRLAFHLLSVDEADAMRLSAAIRDMREQVTTCERCFNVAAGELCAICRDTRRDDTVVCVVERPQDIVVVERTQEFRGRYHVLGGSLSPINGIGPGQLRIEELRRRLLGVVAQFGAELDDLFERHALGHPVGGKPVDFEIVPVPHHELELAGPDAEPIGYVLEGCVEQQSAIGMAV